MNKFQQYLFSLEEDKNHIRKILSEDTVFDRLYPLYKFTSIATILLLLWSGLTGTLFIYTGFYGVSSSHWFSLIPVLLIVSMMEAGKYYLGTYALRFVIFGWLKLGWYYVLGFTIVLPMMVALFFGSYYMSVNGAPEISYFLSERKNDIPLVNEDSIHQVYDAKTQPIYERVDKAQSTTWHGVTTKHGAQLAMQLQEQITDLERQRKDAILYARQQYELLVRKDNTDAQDWGFWLSRFGGYGEILTLFFLAFRQVFLRASSTEEKPSQPEEKGPEPEPKTDTNPDIILYEGKEYSKDKFKAWMMKTKQRSISSKTEKARSSNLIRYQNMQERWNKNIDNPNSSPQ